MNQEERLKRIAEAAYYRSERRGFIGNHELEDWLEAERELASLTAADTEPKADEPVTPPQPDQASGAAIPAPLAKEDRIRAEEIKQSAHDLAVATNAQNKAKAAEKPAPAQKKSRKRTDGKTGVELRRNV